MSDGNLVAAGPPPDSPGLWDLEHLREARRLGDFMFTQFEPFVGPTAVEVGAGIGAFSERLLDAGVQRLLLIEPEAGCVARLHADYDDDLRVTVVDELLPEAPTLKDWSGDVDYVLCQNVLEHIEDDQGAMRAMAASLRPGGRLTILVPANPRLYGQLDQVYGHYRRYTKSHLAELARGSELVVDDLYHFNMLGIPGWLVQNLRRNPSLSPGALRVYELLLRAWQPIELRRRPPTGLSVVLQARRPASSTNAGG